MQVSKFREIQKTHGKYKKISQKNNILRLFGEGSKEKIKQMRKQKNQNNKTVKKNQKIKKNQNYRPHVTPCHNSPDMRCIVFDHTLAN